MREIKLPHLPSDVEARKGDLFVDLWKGKETQIKQDKIEKKVIMKNIVIFGAPGSGKGTQSDLLIEHYGLGISPLVMCCVMRLRKVPSWVRRLRDSSTTVS